VLNLMSDPQSDPMSELILQMPEQVFACSSNRCYYIIEREQFFFFLYPHSAAQSSNEPVY
jgi:hypothetical protein